MKNYNNSVIYKIFCRENEITDIYIGSTINFNKRKNLHKKDCKNKNIKLYNFIRENGGWDNWNIEVIENYVALDKQELCKRERYYYDLLKPSLNMCLPYRTEVERCKKYHKEYCKKYYEKNKEKFKENKKKYYENNKEKYKLNNSKRAGKITCECGSVVSKSSLARHKKTTKHKKYYQKNKK